MVLCFVLFVSCGRTGCTRHVGQRFVQRLTPFWRGKTRGWLREIMDEDPNASSSTREFTLASLCLVGRQALSSENESRIASLLRAPIATVKHCSDSENTAFQTFERRFTYGAPRQHCCPGHSSKPPPWPPNLLPWSGPSFVHSRSLFLQTDMVPSFLKSGNLSSNTVTTGHPRLTSALTFTITSRTWHAQILMLSLS